MRFHGHYFTFSKKNWLHACVYHHRMKPKVGRNFTSERGEGVKGEVKNISLHWLQGIFETVPYKGHGRRRCWAYQQCLGIHCTIKVGFCSPC